jgi:hypothetical protein
MGKQIRFFMTAEDEREFAQFVKDDPDAVFIAKQTRTSKILEFSYPEEADHSEHIQHRTALCIWNKRICGKVTMVQYSPESFAVRGINEELMDFSRCFLHRRTMVAGCLYADMYSLAESGKQLIRKGIEYEKWYNKLASWIRRHYTRDPEYGNNIGPRAREAYESGTLALAAFLTPRGPI